MSPNISGIGVVDQARGMHLAELALEFSSGPIELWRQLSRQSISGCLVLSNFYAQCVLHSVG